MTTSRAERPAGTWAVEHHRGSATAFHARDLPTPMARAVWWFEVERPAVVLGSTQGPTSVDQQRAEQAGVEVVRRRSGGGAVWLAPAVTTWIDVLLPADDPLHDDDVSRAAHWLGEAWVRTLDRLGAHGAEVHRGAMVRSVWSDLVCFAGRGPGEVSCGGRKVVGISQRRTRAGARFQCAVLHRWDPAPLLEVLALDAEERAAVRQDLHESGVGVDELTGVALTPFQVAGTFFTQLPGPA